MAPFFYQHSVRGNALLSIFASRGWLCCSNLILTIPLKVLIICSLLKRKYKGMIWSLECPIEQSHGAALNRAVSPLVELDILPQCTVVLCHRLESRHPCHGIV